MYIQSSLLLSNCSNTSRASRMLGMDKPNTLSSAKGNIVSALDCRVYLCNTSHKSALVYTFLCMCACVCVHVCMCACVHVCMCMQYSKRHVHVCMCMCACACVHGHLDFLCVVLVHLSQQSHQTFANTHRIVSVRVLNRVFTKCR